MEQKFELSDRVVKTSGKKRGEEAEVCYIYNDEQMEIRYCDNPQRYDVKIKNYILASEWYKEQHRPYKPKEASVKWVKVLFTEDAFELNGEKYIAPAWWFSSKLINLLEEQGFMKWIGRFGFLFPNTAAWQEWQNAEIERMKANGKSLAPVHYNRTIYQVLKDINQFNG
ncbi:MAG: hypothetical protein NTZ42_00085 [Candidatus Gribaldobacteria bacterium]|nr:hypothetical protein [Candidatus Gribaldobacteria bacterium]